jgi:hypothetical protein
MLSPSVGQQHVACIHEQASENVHDESEIISTTSHQKSTDSEESLIDVFYECDEADVEDDADMFYECCEHCDTDCDTSASLLELTLMASPCEYDETPAEAPNFSTEAPALLDSEEDVGDECVMHESHASALTGRLFSQMWPTVCLVTQILCCNLHALSMHVEFSAIVFAPICTTLVPGTLKFNMCILVCICSVMLGILCHAHQLCSTVMSWAS